MMHIIYSKLGQFDQTITLTALYWGFAHLRGGISARAKWKSICLQFSVQCLFLNNAETEVFALDVLAQAWPNLQPFQHCHCYGLHCSTSNRP